MATVQLMFSMVFFLETDYMDDLRRPGAVFGSENSSEDERKQLLGCRFG
jgi:predicted urease superfamily metal-dependent hydrolase